MAHTHARLVRLLAQERYAREGGREAPGHHPLDALIDLCHDVDGCPKNEVVSSRGETSAEPARTKGTYS